MVTIGERDGDCAERGIGALLMHLLEQSAVIRVVEQPEVGEARVGQ